jgi:hypothetical protein
MNGLRTWFSGRPLSTFLASRLRPHVSAHKMRMQEDLVGQLFNPSEKWPVRAPRLLDQFGRERMPKTVFAKTVRKR